MTVRIAMLIFVVSFAAITGWLVTREPADSGITHNPPVPEDAVEDPEENNKANKPDEHQLVAISNEEQNLKKALHSIVIPIIDIEDVTMEEALDFLNFKVKELESTQLNSVNFMIMKKSLSGEPGQDTPVTNSYMVTLKAKDISFADAITRICSQTGHLWSIDGNTLVLNSLE